MAVLPAAKRAGQRFDLVEALPDLVHQIAQAFARVVFRSRNERIHGADGVDGAVVRAGLGRLVDRRRARRVETVR